MHCQNYENVILPLLCISTTRNTMHCVNEKHNTVIHLSPTNIYLKCDLSYCSWEIVSPVTSLLVGLYCPPLPSSYCLPSRGWPVPDGVAPRLAEQVPQQMYTGSGWTDWLTGQTDWVCYSAFLENKAMLESVRLCHGVWMRRDAVCVWTCPDAHNLSDMFSRASKQRALCRACWGLCRVFLIGSSVDESPACCWGGGGAVLFVLWLDRVNVEWNVKLR